MYAHPGNNSNQLMHIKQDVMFHRLRVLTTIGSKINQYVDTLYHGDFIFIIFPLNEWSQIFKTSEIPVDKCSYTRLFHVIKH